jgi:hypothetical protein
VLRGRVEADGYPRQIRRAFRNGKQQGALDNAEMSAENAERTGGGEAASGFCEILVNRCKDRFRFQEGFGLLF